MNNLPDWVKKNNEKQTQNITLQEEVNLPTHILEKIHSDVPTGSLAARAWNKYYSKNVDAFKAKEDKTIKTRNNSKKKTSDVKQETRDKIDSTLRELDMFKKTLNKPAAEIPSVSLKEDSGASSDPVIKTCSTKRKNSDEFVFSDDNDSSEEEEK